jgi:hypothetical protein
LESRRSIFPVTDNYTEISGVTNQSGRVGRAVAILAFHGSRLERGTQLLYLVVGTEDPRCLGQDSNTLDASQCRGVAEKWQMYQGH